MNSIISSSRGGSAIRGLKRARIPRKLCASQPNSSGGTKILNLQTQFQLQLQFQAVPMGNSGLPFTYRRSFATQASDSIHVAVDGKNVNVKVDGASAGDDDGANDASASLKCVSDFVKKLESMEMERKMEGDVDIFKLDDLTAREITKAIDTLAHSIHKDDLGKVDRNRRGELCWILLKKLLVEDGLILINDHVNIEEESMQRISIEKDPRLLDHAICHNVSVET